MWWMLGLAGCRAPSDEVPRPDTTSTTETGSGPTSSTDDPIDICDVAVVDAGNPAVRLETPPKNLVLLSIDTLRRDYVDFYACDGDGSPDGPRSRMPFLSSILAQSVTFEDVQQCSNWTFPSTNCTLSGTLLTEMAHVPRGGLAGRPVPDGQRTLASLLSTEGFYTGLVFQNGWFFRILDLSLELDDQLTGNSQGYQERLGNAGGALNVIELGANLMDEVRARTPPPDRWFLHLHFIEPHDLYLASEQLAPELADLDPIDVDFTDRQSFRSGQTRYLSLSEEEQALYRQHYSLRYTADLRLLDSRFQTVWQRLQDEGLLDDTLVVLWTDHGESFWERGPQAHGFRLGAEENDAILAFWHPDLAAKRVRGPHHAIDFLPTTLDALGLPVPSDLRGVLAGTAPADRVRYAASPNIMGQRFQSVTKEGFKLEAGWDGSLSLYDRTTDRYERTNLFSPDHPRVAELWPLLEARIQMLEALIPEGQRPDWTTLNAVLATE